MGAQVEQRFLPTPRQLAYIQSPADITIFGGARGGGKTYGSLGDFWIHSEIHGRHANGLMLRKTRTDLKDTIATAIDLFGNAAEWREHGHHFDFRNGARLTMAYLENEKDAAAYQGWSLTRIYLEEVTQFVDLKGMLKLLGALRSAHGVRCQMKATCNPGGPSHLAVKQMFIDSGPMSLVKDEETGITRVYIPSRLQDNPALLENDPGYINRLKAVGSEQLVRAWLEGDWSVIEGAFFHEFSEKRHVVPPFTIPIWWTRFRAMDWGSAKPFSVGWYAVCQDDHPLDDDRLIPRGAIVRYREYYGMKPNEPNVGLKLPAEEVARQIVSRETQYGRREDISYGVMDPAAFNVVSGPSIGEVLGRHGAAFKRADNTRVSTDKRMSGWNQVRQRLVGDEEGRPMLFFFNTCRHLIRTLPVMQHDDHNAEDLDSDAEDHAVDELRYACMSRPFLANVVKAEDRNPFRVANAFGLRQFGFDA